MSNIAEFLQKILSARYGKDVRQSIHDAIEEIDKVADTAQGSATESAESARKSAQTSSLNAQETKRYRDEVEQFRNEVEVFTPGGYAEVVKNVAENTVKIDTVIEKAELNIKNTASGESIHLTDSADSKAVEFALYGKATQETTTGAQLLDYDAWKTVKTNNGTGIWKNNGITITATGNNAHTSYSGKNFPEDAKIPANEGDVITMSWEESSNKNGFVFIFGCSDTMDAAYMEERRVNNNAVKSISYTVPSGVTFITYRFDVDHAGDTISYKNIMINKGPTPLPYEPYTGGIPSPNPDYPQEIEVAGSSGTVAVKSCGKNLLKHERNTVTDYEGVNIKLNNDGSITINGAPNLTFNIDLMSSFKGPGTFILNKYPKNSEGNKVGCFVTYREQNISIASEGDYLYFTLPDGERAYVACRVYGGQSYNNFTFYPMIRRCDGNGNPIGDDTYEPYKETSSTIPTPNGLAGIPVDSDGNYTDSKGQQRVCNVIVKYADGSGEYVQRVKEFIYDGTESIYGDSASFDNELAFFHTIIDKKTGEWSQVISNTFPFISRDEYYNSDKSGIGGTGQYVTFKVDRKFLNNASGTNAENVSLFKEFLTSKYNEGNPVKALYQLETPIRTPLTAEEIEEIERLCTFYPVTNISNDADCCMEITYMADAKNYIDNRLALIGTAMLSNI